MEINKIVGSVIRVRVQAVEMHIIADVVKIFSCVGGMARNQNTVTLSTLKPYGRCSCYSSLTIQSGPPYDMPVSRIAGLFLSPGFRLDFEEKPDL